MNTNILKIVPSDLRLETTLKCGQSFRWKRINSPDPSLVIFRSTLKDRVVTLVQSGTEISYTSVYPRGITVPAHDDTRELLHDYLNLDVDLSALYRHWSKRDPHFRQVSTEFLGLRMLRQDPFENLLSFICSSNNHISRITQMVQNLCKHYGTEIATVDGETYYSFPDVGNLLHSTLTSELRELGFGYRAKFIAATAQQVAQLPSHYLDSMRSKSYEEAHAALMQFTGVGAKVADCVCLMSLDKHSAVPVDTHVLQIAQRDYKIRVKGSTMTKPVYDQIKSYFIDLWGDYAGWAHSVLFTADLKAFKTTSIKIEQSLTDNDKLEPSGPISTKVDIKIEPSDQATILPAFAVDSLELKPKVQVNKRPSEAKPKSNGKRRSKRHVVDENCDPGQFQD